MCTVSWFGCAGAYHVFFNRDESRQRPRALAPKVQRADNVQCIMPCDPQGGGTWLSTNQYGVSFALLNYYQGQLPKGKLKSRGQIINSLAALQTLSAVRSHLDEIGLEQYPPFSLLLFFPEKIACSSNSNFSIPLLRWSGKTLTLLYQQSPLVSSAIEYEAVCDSRDKLFVSQRLQSVNDFYRLHKSHRPEKSRYSVCMHREDAKTVSFSHVCVDANEVVFNYADGSPCEAPLIKTTRLMREN